MRRAALLLVLSACNRIFGITELAGGEPLDAAPDAPRRDANVEPDALLAACGPLNCLDVFASFTMSDHCYVVCNDPVTYDAALGACSAWTGYPLVLDSQPEFDLVVGDGHLASDNIAGKWNGYHQDTGALFVGTDWRWATGATGQAYWRGGAPNDLDFMESGEEQCSASHIEGMSDTACTGLRGFICEKVPLDPIRFPP